MEEIIDILSPEGKLIGKTALKSEAHTKGWYHATVHVWFYTKDKKILLQKRASVKKVFPNLWDVSVAGHIGAGETVENTAIREVKEEIGLNIRPENLFKINIRKDEIIHPNGIIDREFKHVFLCELHEKITQLIPQEGEVDDLQLFDLAILKDATKHGTFMVPNFRKYYDFIYEKINAL